MIPLLRFTHSGQFDGSGTTSRGSSVTAKITTRVVEIHDNGTMKIEGRQKLKINGEEQEIVISGVIRSRDIGPTIPSCHRRWPTRRSSSSAQASSATSKTRVS